VCDACTRARARARTRTHTHTHTHTTANAAAQCEDILVLLRHLISQKIYIYFGHACCHRVCGKFVEKNSKVSVTNFRQNSNLIQVLAQCYWHIQCYWQNANENISKFINKI